MESHAYVYTFDIPSMALGNINSRSNALVKINIQ